MKAALLCWNAIAPLRLGFGFVLGLWMLWLGSADQAYAVDGNHDRSLELSRADSISVLLFSNERPKQLKLSPQSGPITLRFSGQQYVIEDSTEIIRVSLYHSGVRLQFKGRTYQLPELRVENSEVSVVRIIEPHAGYRYYRGSLTILPGSGMLKVINRIWLEDYIGSVVGSEMNFEHPEALKVQAVIARTYALWNLETSNFDGYDVTDHTMSQVYLGALTQKPRYREAALATMGEILTWSNKLILASFFSTCGGRTVDNESVWKGKPLPYLRAVSDHGACKISPHYRWDFEIAGWKLHQMLSKEANQQVRKVAIAAADRYQNVSKIALYNSPNDGQPAKIVAANRFRLWLIKEVGPRSLKSTTFELNYDAASRTYHFHGKGLGHGVGLCQWGALGLAKSGWKYDDILRFYYKGVEIQDLYEWPTSSIDLAR
jgi:stage II sporulation protein D